VLLQVQQQVQQRQAQPHQLAWHLQQVQRVLEQQRERVQVLVQLLLFYRKQPKQQQQRSRQPKRETCS
jgi:hypothetical protein